MFCFCFQKRKKGVLCVKMCDIVHCTNRALHILNNVLCLVFISFYYDFLKNITWNLAYWISDDIWPLAKMYKVLQHRLFPCIDLPGRSYWKIGSGVKLSPTKWHRLAMQGESPCYNNWSLRFNQLINLT